MTTIAQELGAPLPGLARTPFGPLATLARRRFHLTVRTPRSSSCRS